MRYLGNKTSIVQHINHLLEKHSLLNQRYTFFDAFCGTGTVAFSVHNLCHIILNDNLLFATIYAKGRIVQDRCTFNTLGFNPIEYFNQSEHLRQGFVYNNYSPAGGRLHNLILNDFDAVSLKILLYYLCKISLAGCIIRRSISLNTSGSCSASRRRRLSSTNDSSCSKPINLRPNKLAAMPVVLLPAKGSSTMSSGSEAAVIIR